VVGGGAHNPLWRRIIADAFQLPLVVPLEVESAALGAALQAAALHLGMPLEQFLEQHPVPVESEVCCWEASQPQDTHIYS
jgi:xylulokinase